MDTDTETSRQLLLYEERLEDMRQELVRQYQEHQQATELLRQGHMQQMERQKENQDQLLAELESLKVQLAEVIQNSANELIWINKGTSPGRFIFMHLYLLRGRETHAHIYCGHACTLVHTHTPLCVCVCVCMQTHICIYL